ncbi:MAG: PKD domain-containing protein [Phycisphaerales bacterium]|nr:PKD domain-containing protein [Phycisphaerales bacterium]
MTHPVRSGIMRSQTINALLLSLAIPISVQAIGEQFVGNARLDFNVDGPSQLTTPTGVVSLTFSIQLTHDLRFSGGDFGSNIVATDLEGVQFGLLCNRGDLFVYSGSNSVVRGEDNPFPSSNWVGQALPGGPIGTYPDEGAPLSDLPQFAYFKTSAGGFPAASYTSFLVINVRSTGDLPAGEYTFVTGATGNEYLWTTSTTFGPDGSYVFGGPYDPSATFVLRVTDPGTGGGGGDPVVPGNTPPTAQITADIIQGDAPLTVQFSAAGASDPDGDPLSYAWNFGDGQSTTTSANSTMHTYTTPGDYATVLTVTDGRGGIADAGVVINVTAPDTDPGDDDGTDDDADDDTDDNDGDDDGDTDNGGSDDDGTDTDDAPPPPLPGGMCGRGAAATMTLTCMIGLAMIKNRRRRW